MGLTGQVLEGYARKIFGGALEGLVGKVADAYDGAGRTLDPQAIQAVFAREIERGRGLFSSHQGDVRQRAATTHLGSLTQQLRM